MSTEGLAIQLLHRFGSPGGVLRASRAQLLDTIQDEVAAEMILAAANLHRRALRREIEDRPLIGSHFALVNYLRAVLAREDRERVIALYLNASHRLVGQGNISVGSVSEAACCPRVIILQALRLDATGIIVAHNHPSGDASPSKHDTNITRKLADAARWLDIVVVDHIIVTGSEFYSFRNHGLL